MKKNEKKLVKLFDVKEYKKVKAGDDFIKIPVTKDEDSNKEDDKSFLSAIANSLEFNIKKNKGEGTTIHASLDINSKSFFG